MGFLGARTDRVAETTAFFRDVLGLEGLRTDADWTISQLPTHRFDYVEVFGAGLDDPRVVPSGLDRPMVAFVVDDVAAAHDEVKAAGVEVLGDLVWAAEAFGKPAYEGIGWFFLRAPDGNTYVIEQLPD